jgi:hypothetical protein
MHPAAIPIEASLLQPRRHKSRHNILLLRWAKQRWVSLLEACV